MAGRGLGTLTLELVAKIGGFVSGMTQAERATEKSTKAMAARMKSLEKSAYALGHSFGFWLKSAVIVGGAYAIVKATVEAERAQTQLAAALKSSGGASDQTIRSLNKHAQALQALTSFDDDAIAGAQTLLLQFRNLGGNIFPQATQSTLDLSARMGIDLTEAATKVGKALNDPITGLKGLKDAGVKFTGAQVDVITKLVKTNQLVKAQQMVLDELTKSVGGAAEAERTTLGGAFAALEVAAGNLLEGDSGGDGIRGVVGSINDLTKTLNDPGIKEGTQYVIQALAKMTEFALRGISAFGGLGKAILDAFSAIPDKSMEGLNTYRADLADDLTDLEAGGGTYNPSAGRNLILGGRSGQVNPISAMLGGAAGQAKHLREELAKVDAQLKLLRDAPPPLEWIDPPAPKREYKYEQTDAEKKAAAAAAASAAKAAAAEAKRRAEEIARAQAAFQDDIDRLAASMGGEYAKANAVYTFSLRDIKAEYEKGGATAEQYATQQGLLKKQFDETVAGIKAAVEGPLADATYQYQQALKQLREDAMATGVSDDALAASEKRLADQFRETTAAIKERDDPLGALIADQEFELDLLGKTNAERVVANKLREIEHGMTAQQIADYEKLHKAEIDQIKVNADALEAQQKQISAMDEFRSSLSDNIAAVLDGSKSISDAFKDMANAIIAQIARMIAEQWVAKMFGPQGTSGAGTSGGNWLGTFMSWFGSSGAGGSSGVDFNSAAFGSAKGNVFSAGQLQPFAAGGIVNGPTVFPMRRGFGLMGEAGPEAVMPLTRGPDGKLGVRGGGNTQNLTFIVQGSPDRQTREQLARKVGREARRALARG